MMICNTNSKWYGGSQLQPKTTNKQGKASEEKRSLAILESMPIAVGEMQCRRLCVCVLAMGQLRK